MNQVRLVRVPSYLHTLYLKACKAKRQLESELGRPPTAAEVAAALGAIAEKAEHAGRAMQLRAVAPETPISSRSTSTVSDLLGDETTPDLDARIDGRRGLLLRAVVESINREAGVREVDRL